MSWPEEIIRLRNSTQSLLNFSLETENTGDEKEPQKESILKRFSALSRLSLRDKQKHLAGVINMGNTCYIGAAIQSLSNVDALTDFIFDFSNHSNVLNGYLLLLINLIAKRKFVGKLI